MSRKERFIGLKTEKPYYTLVTRDSKGVWGIYFGDYDRKTVEFEQLCLGLGSRAKIIRTGDEQRSIDLAVSCLNEEVYNQMDFDSYV